MNFFPYFLSPLFSPTRFICGKSSLSRLDAEALVDYFIKEYAPSRDAKNRLDEFEGFIFRGPEYLTMFDGLGRELETIPYSKR